MWKNERAREHEAQPTSPVSRFISHLHVCVSLHSHVSFLPHRDTPRGVSYTSQRIEEEEGSGRARARAPCRVPRTRSLDPDGRTIEEACTSDDYGGEKCGGYCVTTVVDDWTTTLSSGPSREGVGL